MKELPFMGAPSYLEDVQHLISPRQPGTNLAAIHSLMGRFPGLKRKRRNNYGKYQ
jgi:hypothetical protein